MVKDPVGRVKFNFLELELGVTRYLYCVFGNMTVNVSAPLVTFLILSEFCISSPLEFV